MSGEAVTNSVTVRGLNRRECGELAAMKDKQSEVPRYVMRCAVVDDLSDDDLDDMPPALFASAVAAVLELSGMGAKPDDETPEKKAS